MISSTTKAKRYIQEYVTKDRWLRSLMIPALLVLVGYNYFEMMSAESMAEISNANERKTSESINFCLYYIISYSFAFLYDIFNSYFVAISLKSGIINFLKEFFLVNYKTFMGIGLGEAQYCINRRVFSLIEFLESICLDFVSNIIFFIIALNNLNNIVPDTILKVKVLAMILGFILFSCIVQYLRSQIRYKVNLGFDKSSRKLYDILYNYERIISYDNLEYELDKYKKSMDDQIFYSIIYWVSFEVVQFFNILFFLAVNIFFMGAIGLQINILKDMKKIQFVFNKLSDKVISMVGSVDTLANNFVNLDQSLIEDCPLDENPNGMDVILAGDELLIKDLTFIYDSKIIFKNISAKINRGDKIAIVGSNGTGKSTFVKILEGLYNYEGTIEIDSVDYSKLTKKSIRNTISYVPQNSFLFDVSLCDNLKKGNLSITDEKILEYAKIYDFHDLFKDIGYDKRVGERGKYLSGGQRQKISFLRAAIKNAPILILDEATSNMDQISEQGIIDKIKSNMSNTSVLMIVHNLETLKEFDRIFYFGGGEDFEEGCFEELMSRKKMFHEFYNNSMKMSS